MFINSIKIKTFKNFKEKSIKTSKMVLFAGKNGAGKTTLAHHSLLFVFWGYTHAETLKDLPTRSIAKSCSVEVEVKHKNKIIKVIRKYPTKLDILEDGKKMVFNTPTEAQKWINDNFGTRTDFQKFRIVDAYSSDANFLEEGQTTFKKILFAGSETVFIELRKKLFEIKSHREIYCKDKAVIYSHYPSEKRLKIIQENLSKLKQTEYKLKDKVNSLEMDVRKSERETGNLEYNIKSLEEKRTKLNKEKTCYTCNQKIAIKKKDELLKNIETSLQESRKKIQACLGNVDLNKDLLTFEKKRLDKFRPHVSTLLELKLKLEARIKQKKYKFTEKDILIAKQAIQEVDSLSTFYLTESIKVLEPIINDVLRKINFKVKFIIDDKDRFKIRLYANDIEYKYHDLSTGQKLILQIGFKLALLMEQGKNGIMIADEGLGSLDTENLNHIIGLFQNLPFQLFLVLHRFEGNVEEIQIVDIKKEK